MSRKFYQNRISELLLPHTLTHPVKIKEKKKKRRGILRVKYTKRRQHLTLDIEEEPETPSNQNSNSTPEQAYSKHTLILHTTTNFLITVIMISSSKLYAILLFSMFRKL